MLAGRDEILASKTKPGLRISSPKLPGKTKSLINQVKIETATELGH